MLGRDLLESTHEEIVELLLEVIVGDRANIMGEDHVGTSQTHVTH